MPKPPSSNQKLFLYAIAPQCEGKIFGAIGLDGGTVFSFTSGRLSAVVSDVSEKLRPERRHLAAHQEVLKRLMAETAAVLPVAFGVVVEEAEALRRILSHTHNQTTLLAQLRRVEGRVEMGLRVTWDVPNIFEYFVDTHPELRVARDRFLTGHREPSQDDKIEVGRLFDRLLTEDRDMHAERVEEILNPHCVEIKRNTPRNEREVVNLACLVERSRDADFEAAIFEAAKLFDDSYAFDYSGPWAPHNFVDLALDLRGARAPERARA
jgi:hypothetical protein